MAYQIINKYKDPTRKWRVMVDMGNGELKMFKFQTLPTDEEILQEVERYALALLNYQKMVKEQELAEIPTQITQLQSRKISLEAELIAEPLEDM
jgi:hypothetical protein